MKNHALRIFTIALCLAILTSSFNLAHAESTVVDEGRLRGVLFSDRIHAVQSDSLFNSVLSIEDLSVVDNKVYLKGELNYNGINSQIETSGTVYYSENLMLRRSNSITILLDDSNEYQFLTFTIEKTPYQGLLLPANQHLSNNTVVKMALLNLETLEVIYFEDVLPKKVNIDQLYTIASVAKVNVDEEKDEAYRVAESENWFLPFLRRESDFNKEINENIVSSLSNPVSPDPQIPLSEFLTPGRTTFNDNNNYGYFRDTVEWPAGSGNMLTTLMKWALVNNTPVNIVSGAHTGEINASVTISYEGMYYYDTLYNDIVEYDFRSFLRIQNEPYVEAGLPSGNTEIIIEVTRSAQARNGNTNVDWSSLIGVLPFGDTFTSIATFLSSVQRIVDVSNSDNQDYPNTVAGQEAAWTKVFRDNRFTLDSNEYLATEGDRLGIKLKISIPQDDPSYRVAGTRSVYFLYKFDIYSRNIFGNYTIYETTIDKEVIKSYTVQP